MLRLFAGLMVGLCLILPAHAADPVFAKGGSVGLVPPAGMTPSELVQGFEDRGARASILIAEMPPPAYQEVRDSFSNAAALAKQGVTIEKRRDVELAGGVKGQLLSGFQSVGTVALRKWILLAAGEGTTALVTAQLPDEASARYPDPAIEQALLSVVFRPPPTTEELLAKLPFRVSPLEGYRVVKVLGGSAVLLDQGPERRAGWRRPALFRRRLRHGRRARRRSAELRAAGRRLGAGRARDSGWSAAGRCASPASRASRSSPRARTSKTGKPVKVAQWISFGRSFYVRMIGVAAAEGFDADFTALRALRDGVEPR